MQLRFAVEGRTEESDVPASGQFSQRTIGLRYLTRTVQFLQQYDFKFYRAERLQTLAVDVEMAVMMMVTAVSVASMVLTVGRALKKSTWSPSIRNRPSERVS